MPNLPKSLRKEGKTSHKGFYVNLLSADEVLEEIACRRSGGGEGTGLRFGKGGESFSLHTHTQEV